MPLTKLEHYLVISDDIEATRRFYCDALGMRVGFRPELEFDGYWLYVGDVPCIHVAERHSYARYLDAVGIPMSSGERGSGMVDHVAFNGTDFDGMAERLRALGIEAHRNDVADIGLKQLFLVDPSGIKIELNFMERPRGGASSATSASEP
jgi:catechol 2,3-dioxygenase-like lactoylglutathione lyase family enzyme